MLNGEGTDERLVPRKKRVRNSNANKPHQQRPEYPRLVVVGGGIAGVCCAQELARLFVAHTITLVAAGDVLKESSSVMKITNSLEEVSVYERRSEFFKIDNPNIHLINGTLESVDPAACVLQINGQPPLNYDRLCLCTGATPSLLLPSHPRVLGLRDLETVITLGEKLRTARRVVVVGNGGIALELVHALSFLDLLWIMREEYIGHAFFDASASAFIMPALAARLRAAQGERNSDGRDLSAHVTEGVLSNGQINCDDEKKRDKAQGVAGGGVGPEWLKKSEFIKQLRSARGNRGTVEEVGGRVNDEEHDEEHDDEEGSLQVECEQDICALRSISESEMTGSKVGEGVWLDTRNRPGESLCTVEQERAEALLMKHLNGAKFSYPLYVLTSKDKIFGCDFIVSATGVRPCTSYLRDEGIARAPGGEVLVDEGLQSVSPAAKGVFAAGDCSQVCLREDQDQEAVNKGRREERHWFQMKLWSQARSMGIYAAHCIARSIALQCSSPSGPYRRLTSQHLETLYGNSMLDVFAHVTHFFDHKVVLLGRFNAQGLGSHLEICSKDCIITADGMQQTSSSSTPQFKSSPCTTEIQSDPPSGPNKRETSTVTAEALSSTTSPSSSTTPADVEIWTRVTPGKEYVKVTVLGGRMVGALLIGDTGLEEVCENLIMNALDISAYGIHILNPDLDLEDFFD